MPRRSEKKLTGRQQRDLAIEADFLAGLARRDPTFVEALEILGEDYAQLGRLEDGVKADEQVARLRPADPRAHYNLACSYALTDQPQAAFDALNRAIENGYRDFRWLARDPDLAGFRKHPLYRKLRARVRAMRVEVE